MDKILLKDKEFSLFIPDTELQAAIARMADRIKADVAGNNPLFVGILNGAFMFTADLMREMDASYEVTFARYSSYQGTSSTCHVKEIMPVQADVRGRMVILLEDVIDTGYTMNYVVRKLRDEGAADVRVLGIHGVVAELFHLVPVHQTADVLVIDEFDLLHFMRSAETVEEVAEGQARVDGGQVSHEGKVHAFLHGRGAEEDEARLPGAHHVLMVAEDGQGMRGQGAGRHMEDAGQQFAGDLVHVGNHEQEALRGREGAGQRTAGKHAVHGAGRAGLGLHFPHEHFLAHEIESAAGGHLVHHFAHDGRGRDGVDGGRVGQGVGNMRGGVIAVHGFHLRHYDPPCARRRSVWHKTSRRHGIQSFAIPGKTGKMRCRHEGTAASRRGTAERQYGEGPSPCPEPSKKLFD